MDETIPDTSELESIVSPLIILQLLRTDRGLTLADIQTLYDPRARTLEISPLYKSRGETHLSDLIKWGLVREESNPEGGPNSLYFLEEYGRRFRNMLYPQSISA